MTTEIEAEIAAMRVANDEWFASAERVLKSRSELIEAAKEVVAMVATRDVRSFVWGSSKVENLRAAIANAEDKSNAPYGEMCRDPQACSEKGYCPRDPTCGD